MGNTLCKPVPEQFVEPTKKTDPLLTEEAIQILNIENDKKVLEVVKESVILEPESIIEPIIGETIEPVISETVEPVIRVN